MKTLTEADDDRKVWRMVGGSLVESDVKTSIPLLKTKKDNLVKTIDQLKDELLKTAKEFETWKKDNKIQIVKQ